MVGKDEMFGGDPRVFRSHYYADRLGVVEGFVVGSGFFCGGNDLYAALFEIFKCIGDVAFSANGY